MTVPSVRIPLLRQTVCLRLPRRRFRRRWGTFRGLDKQENASESVLVDPHLSMRCIDIHTFSAVPKTLAFPLKAFFEGFGFQSFFNFLPRSSIPSTAGWLDTLCHTSILVTGDLLGREVCPERWLLPVGTSARDSLPRAQLSLPSLRLARDAWLLCGASVKKNFVYMYSMQRAQALHRR